MEGYYNTRCKHLALDRNPLWHFEALLKNN